MYRTCYNNFLKVFPLFFENIHSPDFSVGFLGAISMEKKLKRIDKRNLDYNVSYIQDGAHDTIGRQLEWHEVVWYMLTEMRLERQHERIRDMNEPEILLYSNASQHVKRFGKVVNLHWMQLHK